MTNLPVVPIAFPLVVAVLLLLLHGRPRPQRVIHLIAAGVSLAVAALLVYAAWPGTVLTLQAGRWPAPFGITLVVDRLSALMVLLGAITATATLLFALSSRTGLRERTFFHPLFQIQMVGLNLAFLTGDLFNLYVAFEVLLMASYILLTLGGKPGQLREGFKYIILNTLASAFFLLGLATLYGMMGTLNMADLAVKVAAIGPDPMLSVLAVLFMLVFGAKGGVFPLYFWLPASYPTAPPAVGALLGGMLTKVGVYALIRMFTLVFIHDTGFTHTLILVVAGATMLFGVLGPVAQIEIRRILSFHIISQVGYMIMGLGLFSPLALAGAIYHLAHNVIVKSCLFLISGVTERVTGTTDLRKVGGLSASHPGLALTFLGAGLSLAGLPPLSGFFGKLALVKDGLQQGQYLIVIVSLVVSMLTLYSMLKIFSKAFWGGPKGARKDIWRLYPQMMTPVLSLLAVSLAMGIGAGVVFDFTLATAQQIMNPEAYIRAVLLARP